MSKRERDRDRDDRKRDHRDSRERERSHYRDRDRSHDRKEKKRTRHSASRSSSRDRKRHDGRDRDSRRTHRSRSRSSDRRYSRDSRDRGRDVDSRDRDTRRESKAKDPVSDGRWSGSQSKNSEPSGMKLVSIDPEVRKEAEKAAEQAALEEEMRKRRERVKAWQMEKAKRLAEESGESAAGVDAADGSMSNAQQEDSGKVAEVKKEDTGSNLPDAPNEGAADDQPRGRKGVVEDDYFDDDEEDEDESKKVTTAMMTDFSSLNDVKIRASVEGGTGTSSSGATNGNSTSESIEAEGPNEGGGLFERGGTHIKSKAQRKSLSLSILGQSSMPGSLPGTPSRETASPQNTSQISPTKLISSAKSSPKKPTSSNDGDAQHGNGSTGGAGGTAQPPSSSSNPNPIDIANANDGENDDDEEEDPLDAFMSSLYDGGEIEVQQEPLGGNKGSRQTAGSGKINPFGSNFITLEEIMSGAGAGSAAVSAAGWESDAGGGSPESVMATDEEKEERELKEFMEAMRKADEEEKTRLDISESKREVDRSTESGAVVSTGDTAGANANGKKNKSVSEFGRVFGGEGDVIDESEVLEKKKSALELLEEAKRGKELKPVDHKVIDYIPFRKNLYIVPRALARLSEEEVKDKREELQIKVRGKGCPAPVDSWEQCGLSERILQVIHKHNLEAPFAIQKQAIPAVMCGRDVIGVAKTGSGKTLAFLLPMFRHIQDQPPLRDNEGPVALIMAPARELAFQIFNEAKKFAKSLGLRVACIYGGAGVAEQIAELKRGADIVVCTPGRMIDILTMQAGKLVSLKRVTMVVMDEADRMFDMGFEPQIRMIIQNVRPDRQTVLFSATFPKQIEKLAKNVLKLPVEIVVGERSTVNKDITQLVEVHDEQDKFMRLLQLLGIWYEKGSVLIFVDKQDKCDQLFHDLLKSGYPCLSLHGGKDQLDRDHTLHEFKTLVKTVMVATSVAGRGLDVPEIVVVINYNCPNHIEDYVHRVGRTGRAGRKGTAYTFLSPDEDQYAPLMIKALEKANQPIPQELQDMHEAFKGKVDRGEAHYVSSMSSYQKVKGFTFDASEMNEQQKLASMQRKAYNIEQGIDGVEDDDFDEEAFDGEGLPKSDEPTPAGSASSSGAPTAATGAAGLPALAPLERAKMMAAALAAGKSIADMAPVPPGGVPAAAPGVASAAPVAAPTSAATSALERAKLVAQQMAGIGNHFGGPTPDKPPEPESTGVPSYVDHYMEELEINDYPPQVRRKVTQRTNLEEIIDRTGVAIISRGNYVAPGKKLAEGERKLHLLIEGNSEMQVKHARLELVRSLEEETLRMGASGSSFGRYSVL